MSRHNFSVGVDDVTDNRRREVFDGIALLAGHRGEKDALLNPRYENHVECMERLIAAVHEMMMMLPARFAMEFGEGGDPERDAEAKLRSQRFLAFIARLQGDSTGGRDRGA